MSVENTTPLIPSRNNTRPKSAWGDWLSSGGRLDTHHQDHKAHPWYMVLWLTGVDYFSTLGYQPGIALIAAGAISPIATAILIVVTLLGALPIYSQVASRSYAGQGSIAMLENLLIGWKSKIFVLILLGFAATDFVITMTLSAADAALHAIENPLLHHYFHESAQLWLTIALLAFLAAVFLKGIAEAISVAAAVGIPYILLNIVVLVRGLIEIAHHPEYFPNWQNALFAKGGGNWSGIALLAAVTFPKLALGLSGFETGVSVMPLVDGGKEDDDGHARHDHPPMGRIKASRKLLLTAALIMSVLLITSSFVTTLLIQPSEYQPGGPANGRAIAFIAHKYLGSIFGTVYDVSTILILWYAGASAMAGLINLIPRYLPRFGMAPRWVAYRRPLVLALFAACVIVTWKFDANVDAQGGAYATGVLALMLSAAIAVALATRKKSTDPRIGGERSVWLSNYFWVIAGVFAFTFFDNVYERPDGIKIASAFIIVVLLISALSRYQRATELRVSEYNFADESSKEIWQQVVGKKVNLVPLRTSTTEQRKVKADEVRRHYQTAGPLAFIHVSLLDNRSEFVAPLQLRVTREDENFVIHISGAIAIANTIAYISELIDPISIFVGLTRKNLMAQSFQYLLWGEGETGLMIYKILLRYWEWTPEDDVRPMIFLMSE